MGFRGFFVTGTDTGVGKTRTTLHLMKVLQHAGLPTLGLKPVATGAERSGDAWVNGDALALQREGSVLLPYEWVNPYVFEPPVSPHIAARLAGRSIDLERIAEICLKAGELASYVLVEGVGGWRAPLTQRETVAELAAMLGFPIVLVVGLRLGCLNHALLTYDAIGATGCPIAGWVANEISGTLTHVDEQIETLASAFGKPPLARLPYRPGTDVPGNGEFGENANAAILRALAAYDKFGY